MQQNCPDVVRYHQGLLYYCSTRYTHTHTHYTHSNGGNKDYNRGYARYLQILTHTCRRLRTLADAYAHLQTLTHTCRHLRTLADAYAHLQTLTHTCRRLRTLADAYAHLQTLTHTCTYLQMLTHTLAHTCRRLCTLAQSSSALASIDADLGSARNDTRMAHMAQGLSRRRLQPSNQW
jgi:hypothetical protein